MAAEFLPARRLLHPRFECYRLSQEEVDAPPRRIQLPRPIHLTLPHGHNSASNREELREQSTWNHLLVGHQQILWIEPATLEISSFNYNFEEGKEDPVSLLLTLPDHRQELGSYQLEYRIEFDYPSGLALHSDLNHSERTLPWLFVDGGRRLFLVDLNPSSPRLLAQVEIDLIPGFYKIQSVQPHENQSNTFWVILRAKSTESDDPSNTNTTTTTTTPSSSNKRKNNTLLYAVYLIQLRVTPNASFGTNGSLPYTLDIQPHLHLTGSHDLLSAHYDQSGHRWCLRSSSNFKTITPTTSIQETDNQTQVITHPVVSNPRYNWSQTLSSITIIFPIPSLVTSKSIKILFESNSLHFEIIKPDLHLSIKHRKILDDYLEGLLNYFRNGIHVVESSLENDKVKFTLNVWDNLKVDECTWFVEKTSASKKQQEEENETTFFTIELEKYNKLRWPQVFKSDDRVNEKMDPSELLGITENLSKYTSNTDRSTKRQKRGLGLHTDEEEPTPSGNQRIIKDDEVIDLDHQLVVTGVVLTWIFADQDKQSPDDLSELKNNTLVVKHTDNPVHLISNPIKLVLGSNDLSDSIMIKSDVDGLVFKPPTNGNSRPQNNNNSSLDWTHCITFPALSFILSSKTDICFSFFTHRFSLIFQSSRFNHHMDIDLTDDIDNSGSDSVVEVNLGNLFVYYLPSFSGAKDPLHSTQKIVQFKSQVSVNNPSNNQMNKYDDRIIGVCGLSSSGVPDNHGSSSTTTRIFCLSKFNLFVLDL